MSVTKEKTIERQDREWQWSITEVRGTISEDNLNWWLKDENKQDMVKKRSSAETLKQEWG